MKKLLATMALGAIALAGCAVPGLGNVSPSPIEKTAANDPAISATCRAELHAIPGGDDLVNGADVHLGYWRVVGSPADEVANTLNAFTWSAQQLGAPDCP
jgi:hypothetical protein